MIRGFLDSLVYVAGTISFLYIAALTVSSAWFKVKLAYQRKVMREFSGQQEKD